MRGLGKGVMSAATQVKVLSPEIIPCCIGPRVTFLGSQHRYVRNGKCILDVPGSESVAGKRTVCIGTWENRNVSNRSRQEAEKVTKRYGVSVVGLTNIRGVAGVMPCGAKSSLEVVSGLTQRGGF